MQCLSEEILKLGEQGDLGKLRQIPKADLHAHMTLSAPFSTFQKLSNFQVSPPPSTFESFDSFQSYLQTLIPCHDSLEKICIIFKDALQAMISDSITYAELSLDIRTSKGFGVSWNDLAKVLKEELEDLGNQILVSFDLGIGREMEENLWRKEIPKAFKTNLFKGIDLYGSHKACGIDTFSECFQYYKKQGVRIKIHTGEFCSAEEMMEDVLLGNPDAVQHGIAAAGDSKLMSYLADHGVRVNVCPASNIKLGRVADYGSHPIRRLYDAGVKVTIGTDDYTVFGTSISDEYVSLYTAGVFSAKELEQIRKNGLNRFAAE